MGGGRLRCDLRGSTPWTRQEILGGFLRLLRSDLQDIPIPRSRQFRRSRKQDWYRERRRMDLAWGEHFWREGVSHPVHHEGCFSGLLRIHRRVGSNRELHAGVREREGDPQHGHEARDTEPGAVTLSSLGKFCPPDGFSVPSVATV